MSGTVQHLIGLVLCGGKSSRMGTDKGMLVKDDYTWAEHMCTKLASLGLKTYVSINDRQVEQYGRSFASQMMILDRVAVQGPLCGLLSTHLRFPAKDVLVVPCDLIDLDSLLLAELLAIRQHVVQADVYLYGQVGFTEPLCAVYAAAALGKLVTVYEAGGLADFSVQRAIKQLNAVYLPFPDNTDGFRNYNTPESVISG